MPRDGRLPPTARSDGTRLCDAATTAISPSASTQVTWVPAKTRSSPMESLITLGACRPRASPRNPRLPWYGYAEWQSQVGGAATPNGNPRLAVRLRQMEESGPVACGNPARRWTPTSHSHH